MSMAPEPLRVQIVVGAAPPAPAARQAFVRWLIGGILPELDDADRLLGEIRRAEDAAREGQLRDISQQMEALQARRQELSRSPRRSDAA